MTYAGLGPVLNLHISTLTWILENVNRSALPESTVLHLPAPLLVDSQDVYTLLSPSAHSQCAVAFSHNGKAKVSGLPKYVASTTRSRTQQVYNGTVLNRHRQGTTSSLKLDASQDSARSQIKFIIIIKPQDHPEYRTIILFLNSYQLSMAKHHYSSITN